MYVLTTETILGSECASFIRGLSTIFARIQHGRRVVFEEKRKIIVCLALTGSEMRITLHSSQNRKDNLSNTITIIQISFKENNKIKQINHGFRK